MRTKSLVEPTGKVAEGHEWISPDGHSPSWHRVFQDGKWVATAYEEMDEDEDTEDHPTSDEEPNDEQGMSTEISDSDGGEQGAGGKPGAEPKQRRKRGKVQPRGKGK